MPHKEFERLQAVQRFLNLEFSKEKELQDIVELAARICQTPTAMITLIDKDIQYVKFKFGIDDNFNETQREDAFCDHIIGEENLLMVPDTLLEQRFADNPFVLNNPNFRFYAGSPLTTHDGHTLGSLCVMATAPKELNENQQDMLNALSKQVIQLLEFDASLQVLKDQVMELKNSETKLRSFFESSSSCYLLLGKKMEIIAYNKASSKFIEKMYQVKLTRHLNLLNYLHPSYLADFIDSYTQALEGKTIQFERQLIYEREPIWWSFSFEPARNVENEIIGVSYNATDITNRQKQDQKVLAQNESLIKIANMQSHELRRPVASIMGLMHIFKSGDYTSTKEELMMMEKAVIELDDKIRTIVNYTS